MLPTRAQVGRNDRGRLEIGGCDAVDLADRFGTPLYVLNEAAVRRTCRDYLQGFQASYPGDAVVYYAGKAFLTTGFCKLIEQEGLGLDVCSGGELHTGLAAGFPPQRMCMHGNNKSRQELSMALEAEVGRIVVDSLAELDMLAEEASRLGRRPQILLRVTPGVEAHTHSYIQTGQLDSKFGVPVEGGLAAEAAARALASPSVQLVGLHCHIGSQIFDLDSFDAAVGAMADLTAGLHRELDFRLGELNLGGGLGIRHTQGEDPPPVAAFARRLSAIVAEAWQRRGLTLPTLAVEPGRSIVGEAGVTLYRVGAIKDVPGVRRYVAVDGGMADNPRVALYGAVYEGCLANKANQKNVGVVSIAGKCCESGDMLIWDLALPAVEEGDVLAVFATGAYNHAMASNYNRLPRPAAVLVFEGQADLLVERESYADLIRHDRIPARLAGSPTQGAAHVAR